MLKKTAPTWLASPIRRVIQAVCLLVFLWLFLYVCWPYTARPARVWKGWRPVRIDLAAGRFTLETKQPPMEPIVQDAVLYLVDEGSEPHRDLGPFRVTAVTDAQLQIEPVGKWNKAGLGNIEGNSAPRPTPKETPDGQSNAGRTQRVWKDWLPEGVDPESGRLVLTCEQPLEEPIAREMVLRVVDESAPEGDFLGSFKVTDVGPQKLSLEPVESLEPAQLDKLLTSFGPWSLHETQPSGKEVVERPDRAPAGFGPCSLHEAKPGSWPAHYTDELKAKEAVPAETVLALDPLVSISTALAAKCWVWSLTFAGTILLVCLVVPRGFCGYVCPLGSLLDLFDWAVGRRIRRRRPEGRGWWARLKYYVLAATLIASLFGVLISGFVAAIPVITRGLAFLLTPLQMGIGTGRGWYQVPPLGTGHYVSIVLLLIVLGLGLLRTRFWCKYVCPTGAVFSVGNLLRLTQRKVEASCTGCGRCVKICPFDAIRSDFTTRTADCTFCQTCGGVCPAGAIQFVGRWHNEPWIRPDDRSPEEPSAGRRSFLTAGARVMAGCLGVAGVAGAIKATGARLPDPESPRPVRPPGSVPEREFLQLCIRCGECFQACPNNVLQPLRFEQGLEGLWTPQVVADWSGCDPSCSNCGQVCPTGAIRALPLEEKRVARMGLAVVNRRTCLPYAGKEACQLCVDECTGAGYHAIEFIRVGTQVDDRGHPIADSGFLAPVVLADKCVGCGICQTRCREINVDEKGLLEETAVCVVAGRDKEDRLMTGSYVELRKDEERKREEERRRRFKQDGGSYLPDFVQ